nr:MAG TPA: contryphan [Caudoviricetes sp.]DAX45020.1 MAG TPA: contryphan [Caudoviricetes sp.]
MIQFRPSGCSWRPFCFSVSLVFVDNHPHVIEHVPYPCCYLMTLTSGPY